MSFQPSQFSDPSYVDADELGKWEFLTKLKPTGKLLSKLKPSGKLLAKLKNRPKKERLKWWKSLSAEEKAGMLQGGITLTALGIQTFGKKKRRRKKRRRQPVMDLPMEPASTGFQMPIWGWGLIAAGVLGVTILLVRKPAPPPRRR